MEQENVVEALAALAQPSRLDMFRLLVRAGPGGLAAGEIARRAGLPGPTASFHLKELRQAGLITQRRAGRSLVYAADFRTMNGLVGYLMENCCRGPAAGAANGGTDEASACVDCG